MSKGKKIVIWSIGVLLTIVVTSIVGAYFYLNNLFNKMVNVEISKTSIGITEEVEETLSKYSDTIINIALFGVDSGFDGIGRSDSIMIATIDTHNNKLKLTSIMRDSYVDIEGYGNDKINHAYAFGGPELAINTINRNFNLNIQDFVSVNYGSFPRIIDKIGGIDIEVDEEELQYVNEYIEDMNNFNVRNSPEILSTGVQHMDGTQAIAYCRIRYTTGGDYKRTERHREVLSSIFNKVTQMSINQYQALLDEILPMIETSLKSDDILELGNEVIKRNISSIEQERFPLDGYCQGQMIGGIYYLVFDRETAANQMRNYIFEDTKFW